MCAKEKGINYRAREAKMGPNLDLAELKLGLIPADVFKTVSEVLRETSAIHDMSEKASKLDDYVQMLEDELRKIDGFKRELPLCMLLLKDAIERLEVEKMQCKQVEMPVVAEQFMPLNGSSDGDEGAKLSSDIGDKKGWMRSVQLWSSNVSGDSALNPKSREEEEGEEDGCAMKQQIEAGNLGNLGGAFVAFERKTKGETKEEEEVVLASADVCNATKRVVNVMSLNLNQNLQTSCASSYATDQSNSPNPLHHHHHQQQQKKQRRCWSPQLHQRFVDALHQLGGAQAATPKHIRELMQVDGLTNDEVKSHLQKYRLHVKKLSTSSSTAPSND